MSACITGGEWWFNPDGDEHCADPTIEGPNGPIASIHHITRVVGEGKESHVEYGHFEDGYLIAAAPDLLAALNDLVELVEMDPEADEVTSHLWHSVREAKVAIRKAKGGTP